MDVVQVAIMVAMEVARLLVEMIVKFHAIVIVLKVAMVIINYA